MTAASLFCPEAYIKTLVARGLAPPQPHGDRRNLDRGNWHCSVLEQLDPLLPMPTLQDVTLPQTPGNDAASPPSWSHQMRLYCSTREVVLEKWKGARAQRAVSEEVRVFHSFGSSSTYRATNTDDAASSCRLS